MAYQNPHSINGENSRLLEQTIGQAIKRFREKARLTIGDLSRDSGISSGMLSKIEHGNTSPSLTTIQAISTALNVPVTSLFKDFDQFQDASYVRAGEGLKTERQGTRAGHQYELLGNTPNAALNVEPYLITLTDESDVFPIFQHAGLEFIYMLEGELVYRYGRNTYTLKPGDALSFDSDTPHGPEEMRSLPIRFLSIITYQRDQ